MIDDQKWCSTTGKVVSSEYHATRLKDINSDDPTDRSFFSITFEYSVSGRTYKGVFERYDPLEIGEDVALFYNPQAPSQNGLSAVKRSFSSRLALLIVGLTLAGLLILLGRHFGWPQE